MIDQIETNNSLSLTINARTFLKEIGGWAKFLSILGFIIVGLMVVFGLFAGAIFSTLGQDLGELGVGISGSIFGFIYIGLALLYFFPAFYLFQFSRKVDMALKQQSSELLEASLENLKSHYKFVGIMMIVVLGLYAIAILFGLLGAAMM